MLKKVSYLSIHLIHTLAIQLLQLTLSFFLYVLYLWSDWTLGDFQLLKLSYFKFFFCFIIYYIELLKETFFTKICQKSILLF